MPNDPLSWLDDWVRAIGSQPPASPELEGDYIAFVACTRHEVIARLVADATVRKRLQGMFTSGSGPTAGIDARQAVQKFLTMSTLLGQTAYKPPGLPTTRRSDVVSDIEGIAKSVASIRRRLTSLSQHLKGAVHVGYLESRAAAGNPAGYSLNRRGWGSATRPTDARTIMDLLECLECDVREEVAHLKDAISARRQRGGKLRLMHGPIDGAAAQYRTLCRTLGKDSGVMDAELVAAVVNCVLQPPDPLASDTVRKRMQAAEDRKTRD